MAVFHRVGIALVAVLAAAIPSAAQSPSEHIMLDWLALVRSHRSGTMDDASTSASEWAPDQVEMVLPQALATIDAPTLIRALSMHTDIALAQLATMARPVVGSRTAVVLLDGRPLDAIARAQQWRICWRLAAGLVQRGQGPAVASWFRATGAALQQLGDCDLLKPHLGIARLLFPRDAVLTLYAGTLHQTFADPRVQQFLAQRPAEPVPAHLRMIREQPSIFVRPRPVRPSLDDWLSTGGNGTETVLPDDTKAELGRARDLFRRALELDPSLPEAQIRLAHVLADSGEHAQAVAVVRPALAATLGPFLEFYAAVILGRSEEHLGNHAAAGDAYARAAARFAGAESAEMGRSRVALAQGRADDALAIAVRVVGPGSGEHPDPWSSYFRVHDPDANALLTAWRAGLP